MSDKEAPLTGTQEGNTTSSPDTKGSKSPIKKTYLFTVALVIVIVVVTIVALSSVGGETEVNLFYSPDDNGIMIFADDEESREIIPAVSVSIVKYSENKGACCILAANGSAYSLYYVKDGEYELISDGVSNRFAIDFSGSSVVFYDSSGTLKKYTANNGKIRDIVVGSEKFAVSPGGKSIIYNISEDGEDKLYLYTGNMAKEIGTGYVPVAISDDNEYIYVIDGSDNSLCILDDDGAMKSKLSSDVSTDDILFSEDLETVVFSDGDYTYMSVQGKSRIRLIQGSIYPVMDYDVSITCDSENSARIYSTETLCEMYYYKSNNDGTKTLFYIDKNGSRTDTDETITTMSVTDKNELIFLDNDGTVCLFSKGIVSEIISDAYDMKCTSDGKYIYYLNSSNELVAYKNGETITVAQDVVKFYMTGKDKVLFITSNGNLYISEKFESGEQIDTDVYSCTCTVNAVFYYKNYSVDTGVFELYSSDGDGEFSVMSTKASWIM